jgi:hypothetical protein
MDSGVSVASRSSTLVVAAAALASMLDWTSSAFAWAAVTFSAASSMNFLRTS